MKFLMGLFLLLGCVVQAQDPITADAPTLINGKVVDRKDYPATIWIGNCTASIVGPRTVYTAAHCVGGSIAFSLGPTRYTASCMKAPEYGSNPTADYAMCYINAEIKDLPYENVNIEPGHVTQGSWVLQSGYGCTTWGGRIDGQLRVGKSKVLTMPQGSSNDYVTGEGSVLCSGDSGGPAWSLTESGDRDRLISVNSRSNTTSRSYLSAIATPTGIKFVNSYVAKYSTPVCGVTKDAVGCRNTNPTTPQTFKLASKQVSLSATWQPTAKYSVDEAKKVLNQALVSLEGASK